MAKYTKGKLCSCGFPQSYPLPHEHDRTEREKQIIAHYQRVNLALYEALKAWQDWECGKTDKTFSMIQEMRMDALALVEGKEE